VRASSSVGALDHAGTIAFDAPTAGDFKTVTVSGDYVGNGGQWIFNRALGDDTSLGDQLVINGNSSGTASVTVRNAGGTGALTQEGIRLITVAGQSDAQFSLQGRAVAGAYDYFLFKGGVSTPDDGNWYLR
ncbi:autotransporter outer membrane beta-barrel domain-containing protein, partial [Salmonella enterica subsp. enterica]|nr:autotransporter outer membrane beta-barrel domain-containing protein [Salmonella enterica subsp. enterica serovar Enteritidis]